MTLATPDPPVPTTVAIAPPSAALHSIGDSVRMIAMVSDQYGQAMANVAVAWNSSDASVATVTEGLVTAVGNGSATVTATAGSATASAEARVAQEVAELRVSPPPVVLVAFGDTVRLTAEAMDANGHTVAGTAFAWTAGDTLVAMVDSTGLITAVGNGTTSVAANVGEAMGEAMVTVMQSAASVIVTPAAGLVALGDTLRLSVEARDENGHSVAGANFRWSSSDGSVATVDSSGLVRGVAEGAATISTASGSAQATAAITVSNPDRPALVALYEAADGPNWANSENWLTDAPLRDWHGVRMFGGRVAYLNLGWNGLTGPIPAQLGTLTRLRRLRLDHNALTGPIPPELGDLASLELLDLGSNELFGPIPRELGRLANLERLILSRNALTGPIPPELGNTSLGLLWLSNNNLTGPIPSELGKLKELRSFVVKANPGLRGEIPTEVLALPLENHFQSYATGLCVPRTGDFDLYVNRHGWIGYVCGETEPGFQIELDFHPDVPDQVREAMQSQAEYWMEILRETEAPDLFGYRRYHRSGWPRSRPDLIDDIVVNVKLAERTGSGLWGVVDLFEHRLPYHTSVSFSAADAENMDWLEPVARHLLGHVLGIGTLWDLRRHLRNPSTREEVRDTYVVSPLAQEAFDAAGGASYTGPKVPVQQREGRNHHWRTEVFGSELMSWGWSVHMPTSAVTLQALADLGYQVDLSLADPYTLPGSAAAAAFGTDEPRLESGWEAPPTIVLCRPPDDPLREPEGLNTGLSRARPERLLANSECQVEW